MTEKPMVLRGSKIKGTVQILNFTTEPTVLLFECVMQSLKDMGCRCFFVANKTNLAVCFIGCWLIDFSVFQSI